MANFMRIKQLLSITLLASLGLSAIAQVASAVPVVGKETRTGDIYVSGLASYQSLKASYSSLPKVVKKSANECGFFKISNSTSTPLTTSSNIKLNAGSAVLVSSLPVEAAPKCTNGVLSGTNLAPSAALRTAEGDVYFTGLADFSQNTVSYLDLAQTRSVKANTCGIAKLSNSGDYSSPTGTITITDKDTSAAVTTITLASVMGVSGGPVCRNGAAFYTADWPN